MSDSAYDNWVEKGGTNLAGDFHDDDGTYIDDLFEASPKPPDASQSEKTVRVIEAKPVKYGRLITQTHCLTVANLGIPFLALPADENRKHVSILVTSTGTDFVLFSDEPNKLTYDNSATTNPNPTSVRLISNIVWPLDDYTGPVYLVLGKTGGTTIVTLSAVTN